MQTPKIAFLGLGEHAIRAHLSHLQTLNCIVVGFYDPQVDEAIAEQYGICKYVTEEDVLNDSIDAVFICSPDKFHIGQMEKAVDAGKHIFCEKPMFVDNTDIERFIALLEKAKEKNLIVSTCHPRRFDPPVTWLHQHMPDIINEIGAIKKFVFRFEYHEVTDEWKKDRSLLSDHFGHEIDLFAFLFKNPVFTATTTHDSFAAYNVTGETNNGISFEFDGKRNKKESVYDEWIDLHGENGSMTISLNSGQVTYTTGKTDSAPAKNYEVMFAEVNKNFINAISGEEDLYLTMADLQRNNITAARLKDKEKASWAVIIEN